MDKDKRWERHGTACFNGGELIDFNGVHELDSSIIWVTNLSVWDLSLVTGSRSNLRCDFFLTVPLIQIFYDIGASKEVDDLKRVMPTVSKIIANTVQWLEACYPSIDFGDGSTLKKILFEKNFIKNFNNFLSYPEELQRAVSSSTQRLTKLGSSEKNKPRTYAIRANLTSHTEKVFFTDVPSGTVSVVKVEKGQSHDSLIETAMKEERFLVANIVLRGEKSPLAALNGFGQASVINAEPRTWASGIELSYLQQLYDVEIKSFYLWENSEPISADRNLPSLLTGDPLDRLAYSNQLASLAVLAAATEPLPARDGSNKATLKRYSAQSMVLNARDRALTMLMAAELQSHGFAPYLYKNGQVFVAVNGGRFDELNDLVDEKGWSFPVRENLNRFFFDAQNSTRM